MNAKTEALRFGGGGGGGGGAAASSTHNAAALAEGGAGGIELDECVTLLDRLRLLSDVLDDVIASSSGDAASPLPEGWRRDDLAAAAHLARSLLARLLAAAPRGVLAAYLERLVSERSFGLVPTRSSPSNG